MNSERKLATILATDCVNFSKHMEENEELTLTNLNDCRKIIDEVIAEFGGKIFSTAGDSVVAEFSSPVQCVKAAIKFQDKLYERNEHSLTKLQLSWRVGIHVDDVIVENNNNEIVQEIINNVFDKTNNYSKQQIIDYLNLKGATTDGIINMLLNQYKNLPLGTDKTNLLTLVNNKFCIF